MFVFSFVSTKVLLRKNKGIYLPLLHMIFFNHLSLSTSWICKKNYKLFEYKSSISHWHSTHSIARFKIFKTNKFVARIIKYFTIHVFTCITNCNNNLFLLSLIFMHYFKQIQTKKCFDNNSLQANNFLQKFKLFD